MTPNPTATGWMCWFDAVSYHREYFKNYAQYFDEEMVQSTQPPVSVRNRHALFCNEKKVEQLCLQLLFVTEECKRFTVLCDLLQSRRPVATKAHDVLVRLLRDLEGHQMITVDECGRYVESKPLDDFEKEDLCSLFKEAYSKATEKLRKYLSTDGQPAANFLEQVRIFNPAAVVRMPRQVSHYKHIPGFADIPPPEMDGYVYILAPQAISASDGKPVDPYLF